MEELKCILLGFDSQALRPGLTVSHHDPTAAAARQQRTSTSTTAGHSPQISQGDDSWLSPALRQRLHPSEVSMLEDLLPLGKCYSALSSMARDGAVGRIEGLYPSAVATAVHHILQQYSEDVQRAATPSALAALRSTYDLTFKLLCDMVSVQEKQSSPSSSSTPSPTKYLLQAIQFFITNKEVPPAFSQIVGECVWRAVLFTIAHYVAHGVVLHGRRDFFISIEPVKAARGGSGNTQEEHTLHAEVLPLAISVDLGTLILAAGKERRVLLTDAETHGADYLEQLAMGAQDEAADAVFKAIFNLSLCEGGVLAVGELTARVEAAKTLWSRALWTKVGLQAPLVSHLEALQNILLCRRGDFWCSFVERSFDVLCGTQLRQSSAESATVSSFSTLAATQRAVVESFSYAMSVSGLDDSSVYEVFRPRIGPDMPLWGVNDEHGATTGSSGGGSRSVEGMAVFMLNRVSEVIIHYAMPQGLQLIVSNKALTYYERLFSFNLRMRFALHALNNTRQLFSDAIVTNAKPSTALRRAYAVFQLLHFLQTTLGYYLQIDVIQVNAAELMTSIEQCRSVQDAKRAHDRFVWRVSESSFLTEGSEDMLGACRALLECSATLATLCTRYKLNYWAVAGINTTPIEVSASLTALETRIQQSVVSVFTAHLSVSSRPNERALWTRLDFNRYFSYRPSSGPTTSGGSKSIITTGKKDHHHQRTSSGTVTSTSTSAAAAAAVFDRPQPIAQVRPSYGGTSILSPSTSAAATSTRRASAPTTVISSVAASTRRAAAQRAAQPPDFIPKD